MLILSNWGIYKIHNPIIKFGTHHSHIKTNEVKTAPFNSAAKYQVQRNFSAVQKFPWAMAIIKYIIFITSACKGAGDATSWHWPFISYFNAGKVLNNTQYISSGRQLTTKINTQHKINVLTQTILPLTLTLLAL